MCFRGGGLSGVTDFSYRLLPTRRRRFLALEQEGLSVMRLMFPACRVDSIAVLIQPYENLLPLSPPLVFVVGIKDCSSFCYLGRAVRLVLMFLLRCPPAVAPWTP